LIQPPKLGISPRHGSHQRFARLLQFPAQCRKARQETSHDPSVLQGGHKIPPAYAEARIYRGIRVCGRQGTPSIYSLESYYPTVFRDPAR